MAAEVIDMKDYDPDDQLADEVRKSEGGAHIIKKKILRGIREMVYCCDVQLVLSGPLRVLHVVTIN